MLKSLYIKNYALIEEIDIAFDTGLTIITGETGAGKSILIDAFGLLLGERASSEMVRTGTEKTVVEGRFALTHPDAINSILEVNGCEQQEELLIRREVNAKGQSRCFVNDSPVSVATLKEIGDRLVDLHGQHEHQSLLRSETHIGFLDDFGNYEAQIEEFHTHYKKLIALINKKKELEEQESRLKAKKELSAFQIKEIDAVGPQPDEEEQIEAELRILENAEHLQELTTSAYALLYESDASIKDSLSKVRKMIDQLKEIDNAFDTPLTEVRSAEAIVDELSKFVQRYSNAIEFNPERLEELRERLGALTLLKKKYGGTIDEVLRHRTKIGEEFALAENFEEEIAKLEREIAVARKSCGASAQTLSGARAQTARQLQKQILSALQDLGIPKAKFTVAIDQRIIDDAKTMVSVGVNGKSYAVTPTGVDTVEFFLSTNVGEEEKALVKVASGGEVSRIMLALKSALAQSDKTPILIFDEIDTGVSGRIGQAVGSGLKNLSRYHQVIAITHLPQIAAQADHHIAIEKTEKENRTTTMLRHLSKEERVKEVAKLLSGSEITDAGMTSARELMGMNS